MISFLNTFSDLFINILGYFLSSSIRVYIALLFVIYFLCWCKSCLKF